jgi:hypothetical protein
MTLGEAPGSQLSIYLLICAYWPADFRLYYSNRKSLQGKRDLAG